MLIVENEAKSPVWIIQWDFENHGSLQFDVTHVATTVETYESFTAGIKANPKVKNIRVYMSENYWTM